MPAKKTASKTPSSKKTVIKNKEVEKKPRTKSTKKRVNFALDAADAEGVVLVGCFTDWAEGALPMKKNKDGIWKKMVNLNPGSYEYRFLVDGSWRNDPDCPDTRSNGFGEFNNLREV
ncbi:glycogen-binding domain-containing protein [Verrucomicrobia bacterium]|nr:glycogen-binding domain-containing protein [Verrucomicrobiota bacterium]MDB4459166.1 glycogen-binding domain-containing protein [bacterium]